jgi:peroxiredoxin Q/BCP
MPKISLGKPVPDFSLPSTEGDDFHLSENKGKKIVLYFYPKDATPGCTIEGHEFTQLLKEFKKNNTEVYGISRDTMNSHCKFREKENYAVHLLSDENEKACQLFDVIKEKNMYGKKVMGIERSTFMIDESGKLLKEWRKVKAEGHAKEVLESLKSLK